jgi:hypothetical protein
MRKIVTKYHRNTEVNKPFWAVSAGLSEKEASKLEE